ncbi:MAG: Sulfate permease [uncultured Campylobacterales bacterium]|uniref:Sulfate permease n=1 Tax=uncultured Campylobacterales bacterium TaxID=352960 RepID=A0A6S6SC26_9BACT|nr:MAG: Sulfate permease [uncultured Campylobacterales bacterium]
MIEFFAKYGIKSNVLSGIVVAIALVPEAIAFSLLAGVSPLVGLYTAFILGLITSLIGGKAGMVSGATGAIAIVLVGLGIKIKDSIPTEKLQSLIENEALSTYILQYILVATVLAGIIQITIGLFKLGKLIRLVPQPAMYGFVNGLAIVIAYSQIPLFEDEGWLMYALVILTMLIVEFFPKITKKVPSGLVAIMFISALVIVFNLDTKQIKDLSDISGAFPSFGIPNIDLEWNMIMIVLPYAFLVAMVGLIESLLTLSVLDEMGGKRGNGNKECIAQGSGNVVCGFFGGMAGCAMIGQSIINFTNGGRGRLSSFVAAVLLILFVVAEFNLILLVIPVGIMLYAIINSVNGGRNIISFFVVLLLLILFVSIGFPYVLMMLQSNIVLSDCIALIPVAVLVGIMFMVSIGTFEWESANRLRYMPMSDKIVLILVTVVTVFLDLAVAVIAGIIISALVFAWRHAKVYALTKYEDDDTKVYTFNGPLFFASTTSFMEQFKIHRDPQNVILDFKNARVVDISGVEAIDNITKKYRDSGKNLKIRHLSKDCIKILNNAGPFCEYNEDDPKYKLAID